MLCNMRVQEVEYVKAEARLPALLGALQKTAPPVLVFAEKKADVDAIHEYLLLKGVGAVCIHGGLSQEDRFQSLELFRSGTVLILQCIMSLHSRSPHES